MFWSLCLSHIFVRVCENLLFALGVKCFCCAVFVGRGGPGPVHDGKTGEDVQSQVREKGEGGNRKYR